MMPSHSFHLLLKRYPTLHECGAATEAAFHALAEVFENGNKLLVCGNGGSASDAEHIVSELMKGFLLPRSISLEHRERLRESDGPEGEEIGALLQGCLRAVALTSHGALASAIGNDTRGDMIFAQQVYGLGDPGDALLGISTSGNSRNVLNAFRVARMLGMKTVALTGRCGGKLAPLADIVIHAPADAVTEIQELHLPIYHALCAALEMRFFSE
jgi:D-sedoheptulose 7-phosphate isomerase